MTSDVQSTNPPNPWPQFLAAAKMWSPPAYRTADEWADNCRELPPGSPFPGRWKTSRTPYLAEPMRAFADPGVDTVVFMCASQMGKTEAGFNVLGWMWDTHPAPAMWVTPTEKLARTLSRDRLNAMFKTVDGLWDKVDKRFAKPGSLERWIAGVRFGMAWAGSATELASHPCKFVFVDERSRMDDDVAGEGDPVRVASARTKMYRGAKVGVFSSPTMEGLCPTNRWWLTGSKMRWCWRCPSCGDWLFPCRAIAGYPEKAAYETIRAEAWIECPTCLHQIRDEDRPGLEAGYIPSLVGEDGKLDLHPGLEVRNSVASYWATGFASLVTGIGRIMEEIARAHRDGEPGDMQAAVNTYAGELWHEPGEGASGDQVKECQIAAIPDDEIQMVTAGIDVQKDSLYYVVRGWGANVTSYLLDRGQLYGATEFDDVWLDMARTLSEPFCGLYVTKVLVDSGYNTATVYEACRRHSTWEPSKGVDHQDRPFKDSTVDESATGRAMKTLRLWTFSTDTWKTWLYAKIKWDKDKPGAWFVPAGIDDDYCQQVTNEQVKVYRGRRRWFTTGSRQNHYGDCEVLAAVAAHILNVRTLRPRPELQEHPPETPPPPRPQVRRYGGNQRRSL